MTCLTCLSLYPRDHFQISLASLNPPWNRFLKAAQRHGAFGTQGTREERIRTNPDGDVDLPGVPYTQFRYPPCLKCLNEGGVHVDKDGAHLPQDTDKDGHTKGVLKPSVVFFGEGVQQGPRDESYRLVEECDKILVVGSSLATYSAWKLVREVARGTKGFGIINLGGVRGETKFFEGNTGERLRIELAAADVMGGVVESLEGRSIDWTRAEKIHGGIKVSGLGG